MNRPFALLLGLAAGAALLAWLAMALGSGTADEAGRRAGDRGADEHRPPAIDAPALAARGAADGASSTARASIASRHIAALRSDDPDAARAALDWLWTARKDGRLSTRDLFELAMLTGLSAEAEVLRETAFEQLTTPDVDLASFLDEVLALARSTDEAQLQRVRAMLAQILDSWRHGLVVEAAEAAGRPAPPLPLAGRIDLVRALLPDRRVDLAVRLELAESLEDVGSEAVALVPMVFALLPEIHEAFEAWVRRNPDAPSRDYPGPSRSVSLAYTLAAFGPSVLPHVLPHFGAGDDPAADLARDTLQRLGAAAEPTLLRAVRSADPALRKTAAYVLTWTDAPSAERVRLLHVAAREDPDDEVRATAGYALPYQGEAGAAAATELLRGKDVAVRAAIIDALEHHDELLEGDLLAALIERYEHPHDDEVAALLDIVEGAGDALTPATYGILRLLPRLEEHGMRTSLDVLSYLGEGAMPWFLKALESDATDLHPYAARGLALGGPLTGDLKRRAVTWLRDHPASPLRIWAAAAIADPREPDVLRILEAALDAGPWETRHAAATTLAFFEGQGTRYLDRLATTLAALHDEVYGSEDLEADLEADLLVGMLSDLESTWRTVLERDFDKPFDYLEHPAEVVRQRARNSLFWYPAKAAPFALARWPRAPASQRDIYLRVLAHHDDFRKVHAILASEAAKEPVARARNDGVPMVATESLLDHSPAAEERSAMARKLAAQAFAATPNRWAVRALRDAREDVGRDDAAAAVRAYIASDDAAVRTRAREVLAYLEQH